MQIASITPARHAEFLDLVNAEIRPDRAKSNAEDDFPLILSSENADWILVTSSADGRIAAAVSCLIRDMQTSCGSVPVAGIGSVVTRPEFRGRGLSSTLQNAMLDKLRRKNVPLAVLWTDKPEIYAGRGFVAAGWELHIDLAEASLPQEQLPGFRIRPYEIRDASAVGALYDRHPLRTVRHPGDAAVLYGMKGTSGLVATGEDDTALAAVFCGKGADFSEYVAEWSGPVSLVEGLLAEARRRGWARYVLVPAGHEVLVSRMAARGARIFAQTSGYWAVLQPDRLGKYLQAAGVGAPVPLTDPRELLGSVDTDGQPQGGLIGIGIWGLDSV